MSRPEVNAQKPLLVSFVSTASSLDDALCTSPMRQSLWLPADVKMQDELSCCQIQQFLDLIKAYRVTWAVCKAATVALASPQPPHTSRSIAAISSSRQCLAAFFATNFAIASFSALETLIGILNVRISKELVNVLRPNCFEIDW